MGYAISNVQWLKTNVHIKYIYLLRNMLHACLLAFTYIVINYYFCHQSGLFIQMNIWFEMHALLANNYILHNTNNITISVIKIICTLIAFHALRRYNIVKFV